MNDDPYGIWSEDEEEGIYISDQEDEAGKFRCMFILIAKWIGAFAQQTQRITDPFKWSLRLLRSKTKTTHNCLHLKIIK